MSLKPQLEERLGFSPPAGFVHIAEAFSKHAGSPDKGIELLENYLGLGAGIGSMDDGRGYESTPVELFPFLYTGGDGEMYGYLNAAPELDLPDLPMADFIPGDGEGVVHIGNTTALAIENLISYMHADDNFARVDRGFLRSLGLVPSAEKGANVRLLKGDEYVRPRPALPKGWMHVMTSDGVGVIAEAARIRPGPTRQWSSEEAGTNFLAEADRDLKAGFPGSALYHLKEAWWLKFYDEDGLDRKELKQRLLDTYRDLGKLMLGDMLTRYFDWV
jgi:hypothetical protein